MIEHPFHEWARRCASNLFHGVRDQLRFSHKGGPGIERPIHERGRPIGEHLLPRGLPRDLLITQRPLDHLADGLHLLDLGQRLRSGQQILRPTVPGALQHSDGHRRDIPLVNQRPGCRAIGPAHNPIGTDLLCPPYMLPGKGCGDVIQ